MCINSFRMLVISLFLINFYYATNSFAQNEYAYDGIYLGIAVPFNKLGGDFDGERVVIDISVGEAVVIPKIKTQSGLGLTLGSRGNPFAGEINYYWSKHDATWLDAKTETDFNIISLDSKLFLVNEQPIQPYLLVGVAYSWLIVKNASVNYYYSFDDARINGFGLNIGGGLAIYLGHRLAISAGIIYRYLEYSTMSGVSKETIELDEPLIGSGVSYNAGISMTF